MKPRQVAIRVVTFPRDVPDGAGRTADRVYLGLAEDDSTGSPTTVLVLFSWAQFADWERRSIRFGVSPTVIAQVEAFISDDLPDFPQRAPKGFPIQRWTGEGVPTLWQAIEGLDALASGCPLPARSGGWYAGDGVAWQLPGGQRPSLPWAGKHPWCVQQVGHDTATDRRDDGAESEKWLGGE